MGGPIYVGTQNIASIKAASEKKELPTIWNVVEVVQRCGSVLLYKKGNRNQCGNYRRVTLLNISYKMHARIV